MQTTSTHARPPSPLRRRRAFTVAGLVLLVSTVLLWDPWLYLVWGHAAFDSKLWKRTSAGDRPSSLDWRVPMVYDLLHGYGLKGRTRAEIRRALGEPDEGRDSYWVGGAGGFLIYWCLELEYDGDRVSGYRWVDSF